MIKEIYARHLMPFDKYRTREGSEVRVESVSVRVGKLTVYSHNAAGVEVSESYTLTDKVEVTNR